MKANSTAEAYATGQAAEWQQVKRRAFWIGLVLLLVYVVCVCLPYHFQGYATMPITYEAAHDPTGLPSFLPINILAYILSAPPFGGVWLLISAGCLFFGELSDSAKARIAVRVSLIAVFIFLVLHFFDYDRINLILDT